MSNKRINPGPEEEEGGERVELFRTRRKRQRLSEVVPKDVASRCLELSAYHFDLRYPTIDHVHADCLLVMRSPEGAVIATAFVHDHASYVKLFTLSTSEQGVGIGSRFMRRAERVLAHAFPGASGVKLLASDETNTRSPEVVVRVSVRRDGSVCVTVRPCGADNLDKRRRFYSRQGYAPIAETDKTATMWKSLVVAP